MKRCMNNCAVSFHALLALREKRETTALKEAVNCFQTEILIVTLIGDTFQILGGQLIEGQTALVNGI